MIDVKKKHCGFEDCKLKPCFNTSDEKVGLFCSFHKTSEMVDVTHKRCLHENCMTHPLYNTPDSKVGLYCAEHYLPNMVDVIKKKCKTHLCDIGVRNKIYEGYCLRCFIHTFPEKTVSRYYKTKERVVIDRVKNAYPNFDWIEDKKIQGGCSKRRPDMLIDFGLQIVIIEIDEYAHKTYEKSCEERRVMQISEDLYHRNLTFIRFNPDGYVDSDNTKIPSCWAPNKFGVMTIKKTQEKNWENRIDTLIKQIQFCVENPSGKTIDIIELFY
jgi:hypothetical protein